MTYSPSFHSRRQTGVTLLELMIVMAIVAILASIAVPSYGAYTRKAHRADAQQFMMDMALRQGEILVDSRAYATQEEMTKLMPVPAQLARYYTITSAPTDSAGFVITATAIGSQISDGNLTLSNTGVKTPAEKW